jgi:hypothetical protein
LETLYIQCLGVGGSNYTGKYGPFFAFGTPQLTGGRIRGYFARFLLSSIMIAVVIRLILLMRESRNKDLINEQLNSAYLSTTAIAPGTA